MRKPFVLIVVFTHLLFALTAEAEEEASRRHQVEEVVVTATRTERKTEETPAGVAVITEEDLETTRLLGVKEALTGIAGVQSETRNEGYDARLIIRGAGLKARYGVREIMVLLDGVPITDPDGLTRLDFVDTQLIERVDVVKGPNSTLYGANAAGGVINIITKSPYEEIKSAKGGYGDNNTQLYNLILGDNLGETYFTLSGTRKSSDGWRERNNFNSNQAGIKLGRLLADGTPAEVNFFYTNADLQLPGTLSQSQFDEDPSQRTDQPWRHSSRDSNVYFTSLRAEKLLGSFTLKPLFYFQKWDHFHPVTGSINDGGADIFGGDVQGDLRHNLFGFDGLLTAGITAQYDRSDNDKYAYQDVLVNPFSGRIVATLSDNKGDLIETDKDRITKWGVYVQESLRPTPKWILDLGIRFDQVRFDLSADVYQEYSYSAGNYVPPAQGSIKVNKTFEMVSPRIGVVYKLAEGFNLYGNISTGFQTPQSSELQDNENLDPSITINYEAGVKARHPGGHSFDLSAFYMDVDDEIVLTRLADGGTSYSNAGETIKKGIEVSAEIQSAKGLYLGGTYTYSDFEYEKFDEPVTVYNPALGISETLVFDRSGNQLPYIPKHQYSLYARYDHPSGLRAQISTYTWGSYYVDNANSEKYTGYDFLTNLFAGWEGEHWNFSFYVDNVFDKKYAIEVYKDTSGELRYYPGAPRTFFGKVAYTF